MPSAPKNAQMSRIVVLSAPKNALISRISVLPGFFVLSAPKEAQRISVLSAS